MSEQTGLYKKLAEVVGELGYIKKTGRNKFQNYDYMEAEALLGEARKPLAEKGVVLLASVDSIEREQYTTSNNKASVLTTTWVEFEFIDADTGQNRKLRWAGQGDDPADKGLGKAYTNAIKTFLRQQFLIPQGDDPEADSETDERGRQPKRQAPKGLTEDQANGLLRDLVGEGVDRGQLAMWLIDIGVTDVPQEGSLAPAVRSLTGQQGVALQERLNALAAQKAAA